MRKILLLEDNPSLAKSLKLFLELEGFAVEHFDRIEAVRSNIANLEFDLALLDVELPDGLGFDLIPELRKSFSEKPIVFITARTDEEDAVRGLELGADDYVRKPCGNKELLVRISLCLKSSQPTEKLSFGDLVIEPQFMRLSFGKEVATIRKKELQILIAMVKANGAVMTRERIMDVINSGSDIYDRTIDSHISHLRRKLKSLTSDRIKITSAYGLGYQILEEG